MTKEKSVPAIRNLEVAIEIGVNPSLKAIFTTTNELPQKKIRHIIRNKLRNPIGLVTILDMSTSKPIRSALYECAAISDYTLLDSDEGHEDKDYY